MELSYVFAALRRRLWLVVVLTLVGLIGGIAFTSSKKPQFEATSDLLIQPSASATGTVFSNDPDRYIAGEVAQLKGAAMAEAVVGRVPGTSRPMLAVSVRVEQKAKTDVVSIVATTESAELSQAIANAYAQIYITLDEQSSISGFDTEIAEIDRQLAALSSQMSDLEAQRALIPPNSANAADRTKDAQLAEQVSTFRDQYKQLLSTQSQLQLSSKVKSRSEILQLAPLPTMPIVVSTAMFAIAGLFAGAMLGVVAAVAWANASRKLLDIEQLGELLGARAIGTVPNVKVLSKDPKVAFENLPDKAAAVIDQLCVRSESSAQGETDALAIAVVGSQRGVGSTTVALAMAGRFARNGARTVVIDGDLADPAISRSFSALNDAGIPGLLARLAAARKEPLPPGAPLPASPDSMPSRVFTPTTLPDVRVLGIGAPTRARSWHRTNVDVVIDAASRGGVDVVVIDGGPLLDSASTVRLCQVVDVVVLVVPVDHQDLEPLGVINRLLSYRSGDLLPIGTSVKPGTGEVVAPPVVSDGGDVDDILDAADDDTELSWSERRRNARAPLPPTQPDRGAAARRGVPGNPAALPRRGALGTLPASPRLGAPPMERESAPPDSEWVARPANGTDRNGTDRNGD